MYGVQTIIIIGLMLVDVYIIEIMNILIYLMNFLKDLLINMNHLKLLKYGQIIKNIIKNQTKH